MSYITVDVQGRHEKRSSSGKKNRLPQDGGGGAAIFLCGQPPIACSTGCPQTKAYHMKVSLVSFPETLSANLT
ncbi:MAG TPA: hypothetical protein VNK04_17585, partial [Gemmataceae bacterium]|nr:hypothetical protein [Gemmataceae bacterium]